MGDIVVGKVLKLEDSTALVHLLEYGAQEAMLPYSELSQKRVKALRNHIKEDSQDVFEVR